LERREEYGKRDSFTFAEKRISFRRRGMFWRRFRDHQTREKRLPAMSFPWFERCLDENCTQTSRKIGCFARSGWDRGKGRSFPSLSRFWIWAKIFFFVGVTRIRRGISLASSSRATRTDTSSLSFTLKHTHGWVEILYNQQSRDRHRSNSAWKKPRRKPLMSLYWTGRWCGWR
jgi:hypothetical protein